jgi:hypothetical protein
MNTHSTDNRWSPGSSGAIVPESAPAAYAARWIDNGTTADILHDRQGFAYDDPADRDRLIDKLTEANATEALVSERDETVEWSNSTEWSLYMRRSGGYIYVDAWLTPAIAKPPAADGWQVVCADGQVRHEDLFENRGEAEQWAWYGHPCLATHTFVTVTHVTRRPPS